jgi:hypothetical protein
MKINVIGFIRKLDLKYKVTLLTTFVIGIVSQGMGLFNKFSVLDDVTNYGVGMTYEVGRWFLDLTYKLEMLLLGDDSFSLSTYNGFLGILLIAISACVVIKTLDIKDTFICAFISGLMVSFPVITCIFGYMFTLHFYMLSLLLGCLGAYYICKKDSWIYFFGGIMLIAMSIGIYQAFIPVITTILCIYLVGYCYDSEDVKKVIRKIVFVGGSCILFMLLYFLLSSLYLKIMGASLINYRGMADSESISTYLIRALSAYKEVFIPKANTGYFMFPGNLIVAYRLTLVLSFGLSILLLVRICKRNKAIAIICAGLMLMLPLTINLIVVMVDREFIHSLMVYGHLFVFVYFAWLIDKVGFDDLGEIISKAASIVVAIGMVVVLLMFCRLDNKCYLKASYAQMDAISYATSLITEIKSTEGYKSDMPVAYINLGNITDPTLQSGDIGHMDDIVYLPYYDVRGYVNSYSYRDFIRQWCGFAAPKADYDYFNSLDEVQKMPHYPDSGSIKIIEGTVVVNF